jgi:asparagine synthase (glutamine-hydrolysing)
MCGIFGSVGCEHNNPDSLAVIRRLLHHRGPDAHGHFFEPETRTLLVHARLAVVDLTPFGAQPMRDPATNSVVAFNGEIYNFPELRAELEARDVAFVGNSDTEVLLKGYRVWGRDVLNRTIGMFALAIWDHPRKLLLLARDRMGEKPLYYAVPRPGQFMFASELRALLHDGGLKKDINGSALRHYLRNGYTATANSIVDGVTKLPPAHYMVVKGGVVVEQGEYWTLSRFFNEKREYASFEAAQERCGELIEMVTKGQLISDVPLGTFLSGGVDSGIVAASMNAVGARIRSFSAGFDEPEFDERSQAESVANYLHTSHTEFSLGNPSFDDILRPYRSCDEPFGDTSAVPTYYLAELTRQHVTVCLSGDGGDELFGGYPTYLADKLYWGSRHLPRALFDWGAVAMRLIPSAHGKVGLDYKLKAFFSAAGGDFPHAHAAWRGLFSAREIPDLLAEDLRCDDAVSRAADDEAMKYWHDVSSAHYLDQAMYFDMKTWLVDDILFKVDRMTMAHSLEARAPFLDHRMVEFAASLPVEYKIQGFKTKRILKEVAFRRFGLDFRRAKKLGFNAPTSRWIASYRPVVEDYLNASGFFKSEILRGLLDEHVARRQDNSHRIMALIGLAAWKEGAFKGEAVPAPKALA